jgi:hypothetical protein
MLTTFRTLASQYVLIFPPFSVAGGRISRVASFEVDLFLISQRHTYSGARVSRYARMNHSLHVASRVSFDETPRAIGAQPSLAPLLLDM